MSKHFGCTTINEERPIFVKKKEIDKIEGDKFQRLSQQIPPEHKICIYCNEKL